MTTIDLKVLDARIGDALLAYATPGSAGLDLSACIDKPLVLEPGQAALVETGITIHTADPGLAALIVPRSGVALASGLQNEAGAPDASPAPFGRVRQRPAFRVPRAGHGGTPHSSRSSGCLP